MNNRRNKLYIPLISILTLQVLAMILALTFMLYNYENFIDDTKVISFFYIFIGLIVTSSIYSLSIINFIKKEYVEQFAKYKKKIISVNMKREISALLMVILLLPAILSLFVIINAYMKSGLSLKQNKFAKRQIRINGVPHFLRQKKVIDGLEGNEVALRMIKNVNEFKKNKIDTVYNCNLFIIQILNEEEIEFEVKYKQKEVYELGMEM